MDLKKTSVCLTIWFCISFAIGDVVHIARDLEPPYYLYDHVTNDYIPPTVDVDLHPFPPSLRPITATKTTTRKPFSTTTEFFLPEIIVNKYTETDEAADQREEEEFNGYPPHTSPHPIYLPVTTSKTTRKPIVHDPVPTAQYLPPPIVDPQTPVDDTLEPSGQYIPSSRFKQPKQLFRFPTTIKQSISPAQPLRMELTQLRCLASPQHGYFKALLTFAPNALELPPVFMIDGNPSAAHDACGIRMVRTKVLIAIRSSAFQQCGVEPCGETSSGGHHHQLCVRLSFPQISGMMTAGDASLTLQCRVQELVAAQTHSLRIGVNRDSQSRTFGTFANGGSQQPYHTQIGLYRSLRDVPLVPGASVQLGEELVLRAHVKAGDGWNHTRLADVFLQRLSPAGDILNSANLVTPSGCVNPTMRSVCPLQPVFEPPLGHRLTFKATMFQGMRSGDEMVLSVKVVGCIQQSDCYVDNSKCDELQPLTRGRRQIEANPYDADLPTDVARLSFRVEMPVDDLSHISASNGNSRPMAGTFNPFAIIGAVTTGVLILLALVIGLYLRNRHKFAY